ncbi:unnamed protein product [Rotaria sp. Silwood1]|nr:unnamed protein product [Rotaria sp. Silwood1]
MDIDKEKNAINNSTSTVNKEMQQRQQEYAMLASDHQQRVSAIMEYQYGPHSHYFRLEQLHQPLQGKQLFGELEEELWNELENLKQNEEQQKQKKKEWEELCLQSFESYDEFNEDDMEHRRQNTPVENMEDEEQCNVEPSTIQPVEKIKEDGTVESPGLVKAFQRFGVYDGRNYSTQ